MNKLELKQYVETFLRNENQSYANHMFRWWIHYDPRTDKIILTNIIILENIFEIITMDNGFDVDYILSLYPNSDLQSLSDEMISILDPNSKSYGIGTAKYGYLIYIEEENTSNPHEFMMYKHLLYKVWQSITDFYYYRSMAFYFFNDNEFMESMILTTHDINPFLIGKTWQEIKDIGLDETVFLINQKIEPLLEELDRLHEIIKNYI